MPARFPEEHQKRQEGEGVQEHQGAQCLEAYQIPEAYPCQVLLASPENRAASRVDRRVLQRVSQGNKEKKRKAYAHTDT